MRLGFPYCYGVFYEYFFTHEPFRGKSIVSVGGMLANVRPSFIDFTWSLC